MCSAHHCLSTKVGCICFQGEVSFTTGFHTFWSSNFCNMHDVWICPTQMKNKYVHVKAEVLRISKLVYFLRIDQIWSHYQAKQEIWRKLNIHFEFQQWEKEMTHFNTKTSIAPFIFNQIQHPGTVLNAEFSQLSESAIGFQIWVINYEEITKLQSGHLSFLRLYLLSVS